MRLVVLQNFRCNGVRGSAGQILMDEEIGRIGNLTGYLISNGLVKEDESPVPPTVCSEALQTTTQIEAVEPIKRSKKKRGK